MHPHTARMAYRYTAFWLYNNPAVNYMLNAIYSVIEYKNMFNNEYGVEV